MDNQNGCVTVFANQRIKDAFAFLERLCLLRFAKPTHVYACAYTYVRIRVRETNLK